MGTRLSSAGVKFLSAVVPVGAVVGIYANGFVFSAFVWSYIGIVIMLFGFRMIVKRGERSYFTLPGHQRTQSATLPIEQIKFESRTTETQQRP